MKQSNVAVALIIAGLAQNPAIASDGVKLLGQPKTFPITISKPGSYRLKKNITVPDENTTAIEITADDVTLDLNGFAILGFVVCTGSPVNCTTYDGTGVGIHSTNSNIRIRNGTVRGMGSQAIHITGGRTTVEKIRATSSAGGNPGAAAIQCGSSCTVKDSIVFQNGAGGIQAFDHCAITGNVVAENGSTGIFGHRGCTITGNLLAENRLIGIQADQSTVIGNAVNGNLAAALEGSNTGYAGNVFTGNNNNSEGQVVGATEVGPNYCGTDTTCP
jgi:parallel beta helix pectate lyase-like protein